MEYTQENPLRLIELFAGIGSQTQALKNVGVPHMVVAISEIDKNAIKSYTALHGETVNLGDIKEIRELPEADFWTYSFPCQDISVAGHGAGIKEGTRSGLLLEVERLLKVAAEKGTLPKYLLLENVKNLVSKKFKADFDSWLSFLSRSVIRIIGRYSTPKIMVSRSIESGCSVFQFGENIQHLYSPKSAN